MGTCSVLVAVSDKIDAARFYVNTSVNPPQSSWVHPGGAPSYGPPPGPPPPDNRGYNSSPYPPQGGYNQGPPPPQQGWGGQPGGYGGYQQGPPQEQRGEFRAVRIRVAVWLNALPQVGSAGHSSRHRNKSCTSKRRLRSLAAV